MKAVYHDFNRIHPSLRSVITILTMRTSLIVAYFIVDVGNEPRHVMIICSLWEPINIHRYPHIRGVSKHRYPCGYGAGNGGGYLSKPCSPAQPHWHSSRTCVLSSCGCYEEDACLLPTPQHHPTSIEDLISSLYLAYALIHVIIKALVKVERVCYSKFLFYVILISLLLFFYCIRYYFFAK